MNSSTLDILKAAALISDPGCGVWAYDEWADHNQRCFDGTLIPCPIQWGLTAHGRSLGAFDITFYRIILHTSLIVPSSGDPWGIRKLLGQRLASDVLLHEMIHQH